MKSDLSRKNYIESLLAKSCQIEDKLASNDFLAHFETPFKLKTENNILSFTSAAEIISKLKEQKELLEEK